MSRDSCKREVEAVKGKFVGGRQRAEEVLRELPQLAEFTLFSSNAEKLVEEAKKLGLEVVAVIPLVGAVVVRGAREALIRVAASDHVEGVDVPRKVRALGGQNGS